MLLKLAITPCRSNPRRYVRIIAYRRVSNAVRGVDEVVPYLYEKEPGGEARVAELRYRDIAPCNTDPEFITEWNDHVKYQAALGRDY